MEIESSPMSKRKREDTDLESDQPANPKKPKYQDQKSPHKERTESESNDKSTKTRDTPRKNKHTEKKIKQKTPEKGYTESDTSKPRATPPKSKHSKEEVKGKTPEKGYKETETIKTKDTPTKVKHSKKEVGQKTPEKGYQESETADTRDSQTKTKHSEEEVKQKSPGKANIESETDKQATEIKQPKETLKSKSPRKPLKRFTESEIKEHQEKEKQKTPQKGKGTPKSKKAEPSRMRVTSKYVFFYSAKSVFSQFHPAKFVVDGQQYNCMEQYMHHQKAVIFKDGIRAREILDATDPLKQKKLGRQVKNFDKAVWGRKSVVVVKYGNEHKYSQNPEMKKLLFDTYPKTLVEASPRDRLWGIGMGASNPDAEDSNNWRGKNLLGYCLTGVRDKLMKEEGLIHKEDNKQVDTK